MRSWNSSRVNWRLTIRGKGHHCAAGGGAGACMKCLHENEPRLKTKERQICAVHKWRLIWSECVQTHMSAQVELNIGLYVGCGVVNSLSKFKSIWSTLRQSHNHVRHRRNSKLPSYLPWMINPLWYTTSLFDAYTNHLYAQFWSQGCDMEFDIYMRRNKNLLDFTYNLGRTYEYASRWREYSIVWGQISRISTSTAKSTEAIYWSNTS